MRIGKAVKTAGKSETTWRVAYSLSPEGQLPLQKGEQVSDSLFYLIGSLLWIQIVRPNP